MSRRRLSLSLWLCAAGVLVLVAGCVGVRRSYEPLRLSEVSGDGDATRRASMRLVVDGLDSDAAARPSHARSQYERALQVDPGNPWAYLAMARHHVAAQPRLALSYLGQTEVLLESEPSLSPRVQAHLLGLRGAALVEVGRGDEGAAMLARAADLGPSVWSDGRLTPEELK